MLPAVKQWHQLLRATMRKSDPITDKILDIVENDMLLSEPHKRIKMDRLYQKVTSLVTEFERVAKDTEVPLHAQGSSPTGTSSVGRNRPATPRADPHPVDTSLPLVPSLTTQGVRPCPSHSPYEHRKADEASFAICKVRAQLEELKKKRLFFRKPRRDRDLEKVIEDRDIVRFSPSLVATSRSDPYPRCSLLTGRQQ